ncbi:MAG: 50S ribosomal protein L19 [Defluviitaleaceae bacterium]|nr:50S ribosomal protein L19 [Defluviitaleaceae bacterium]
MNDIIREIEKEQMKTNITPFKIGDTIKVYAKIIEGAKERIQVFEGTVMKKQNGGVRETFTVRRVSYGVGVEKTWPLHSPRIDKIEVVRRGVVRRAKLFYLRERVGKASKVKEAIVKK